MTELEDLRVGTCAECGKPVTEADSWTTMGKEWGGYPPTVPVLHLECSFDRGARRLAKDSLLVEVMQAIRANACSYDDKGAPCKHDSCSVRYSILELARSIVAKRYSSESTVP